MEKPPYKNSQWKTSLMFSFDDREWFIYTQKKSCFLYVDQHTDNRVLQRSMNRHILRVQYHPMEEKSKRDVII